MESLPTSHHKVPSPTRPQTSGACSGSMKSTWSSWSAENLKWRGLVVKMCDDKVGSKEASLVVKRPNVVKLVVMRSSVTCWL